MAVAPVMLAISGVVGAVGAVVQASAAGAAAQQNAAIADFNRQVAERNRRTALAVGDAEALNKAGENRRRMASIRAAYGHSGLDLQGSPLDVMEDTAMEGELDVAKTRYKGELKAAGYEDEAANLKMKKELYDQEASYAPMNALIGASTKLLSGFGGAQVSGMRTLNYGGV